MIVVGLLAVAGAVGYFVARQPDEPTVVTTVAFQNGELVPTTDAMDIFDVPQGESASSQFELINVGAGSVDVHDVAIEGSGPIDVANECGSLEPNESCLVTVTFSPDGPGEFRAAVIIQHSGINGDVVVPVIATAIDPPEAFVSVDPVNLDFGVIGLGEDESRRVTITNTGDLDVQVGDVRISEGPFVRDRQSEDATSCRTLAQGESCTIDVRLVAAVPGVFEGILVIDHTGENPTLEIQLTGVVPEPANLVIDVVEVFDATNSSPADPLAATTVVIAITNTGQTATTDAFEYRVERMNPRVEGSWIPALTTADSQASFTFEGSLAPGETVTVETVLGFPTREYVPGQVTQIRAEVDSCFATEFIEVPPCRVAELNEEDNVSEPAPLRVFYEVIG